ncbi:Hypothetical Protein FCC1311_098382 [Hondaea fermentalgiana]|uniref:Phosphatidic acid phosphatase type 2/haloperoxidase domain-containing protein n=1 Tax=Hondaea fermentalgiana TaxID=2315210 RepID=A0A2R5GSP9_9STRA|nr:Hypothetical Protein FCC1311_098382 [Hondaea fermentalgiana]|eukprot:GBG33615.1 Hypothetical Protein FCC1311_098382 [Hondaea fermentalgiana]
MSTEASDARALPSNVVRTLPYTLYVGTAAYAAVFASGEALALLVGLVLNEVSNHAAKAACKGIFGKDTVWIKRPAGAMDTGIYPSHQPKVSTTSGMPSGHAQTAWFAAVVFLHAVFRDPSRGIFSSLSSAISIVALAALTAISRTQYGGIFTVHVNGTPRPAHTVNQIILGGVLGVFNGLLALRVWESFA